MYVYQALMLDIHYCIISILTASTIKFPLQINTILVKTEGTHNQALWDAKANTNRF